MHTLKPPCAGGMIYTHAISIAIPPNREAFMRKRNLNFYIRILIMIGLVIILARGLRTVLPRLTANTSTSVTRPSASGNTNLTASSQLNQTFQGLITFQSKQDGNSEIYIIDASGSQRTNLTQNPADDYAPVWSTDGKQIAFISDRSGSPEIFVMNASGAGIQQLTRDSGLTWLPPLNWSSNGKLIAAAGSPSGDENQARLYLVNVDGSGNQLLNDSLIGAYPRWSPNGKWIAWRAVENGDPALFVINAAGGQAQKILTSQESDEKYGVMSDDFDWSPDGKEIAYLAVGPLIGKGPKFQYPFQARARIQIYNLETSSTQTLFDIDLPNNIHFLRWSPDGKMLMFVQEIGMSGCWTIRLLPMTSSDSMNATGLCFKPGTASPEWTPDSEWLLLTGSRYQGDQNTSIFALNAYQSLENPDSPLIHQVTQPNGQDINPLPQSEDKRFQP
jgi:Tol biopolymer transport system component